MQVHQKYSEPWKVTLVNTGVDTMTGGRLKRVAEYIGNETFLLTYGDGLADVDLNDLIAFHRANGKLATVTAVRPPARFGGIAFNGSLVAEFVEKPQIGEGWINGGFFVLEPGIVDYIEGEHTLWEKDPMERLAADGQLAAYRHSHFWQCMDTLRDVQLLNNLWAQNEAPWKIWS